MKAASLLLAAALAVPASAQAPHPNFSGIWLQNTQKSSAAGAALPSSYVNTIRQDRDTITVVTAVKRQDGESRSERTYVIGRDASWDGDALVFRTRIKSSVGSIDTVERWTLSPDRAMLIKTREASALVGRGPSQRFILERQPE
jgi:hypothetical protein